MTHHNPLPEPEEIAFGIADRCCDSDWKPYPDQLRKEFAVAIRAERARYKVNPPGTPVAGKVARRVMVWCTTINGWTTQLGYHVRSDEYWMEMPPPPTDPSDDTKETKQ